MGYVYTKNDGTIASLNLRGTDNKLNLTDIIDFDDDVFNTTSKRYYYLVVDNTSTGMDEPETNINIQLELYNDTNQTWDFDQFSLPYNFSDADGNHYYSFTSKFIRGMRFDENSVPTPTPSFDANGINWPNTIVGGSPIFGEEHFQDMGYRVSFGKDGNRICVGSKGRENWCPALTSVYDLVENKWKKFGNDIESATYPIISGNGERLLASVISTPNSNNDIIGVAVYDISTENMIQLGSVIDAEQEIGIDESFNRYDTQINYSGDRIFLHMRWRETKTFESGSWWVYVGKILVYDYINNEWVKTSEIHPFGEIGYNDLQGFTISNDGNRISVHCGDELDIVSGDRTDFGLNAIYEYNAGEWNQIGQTLQGTHEDRRFGAYLNGDGNTIIRVNDYDGVRDLTANVQVLTLIDNQWVQLGNKFEHNYYWNLENAHINDVGDVISIKLATTDPLYVVYKLINNKWEKVDYVIPALLGSHYHWDLSNDATRLISAAYGISGPPNINYENENEFYQNFGRYNTMYQSGGVCIHKISHEPYIEITEPINPINLQQIGNTITSSYVSQDQYTPGFRITKAIKLSESANQVIVMGYDRSINENIGHALYKVYELNNANYSLIHTINETDLPSAPSYSPGTVSEWANSDLSKFAIALAAGNELQLSVFELISGSYSKTQTINLTIDNTSYGYYLKFNDAGDKLILAHRNSGNVKLKIYDYDGTTFVQSHDFDITGELSANDGFSMNSSGTKFAFAIPGAYTYNEHDIPLYDGKIVVYEYINNQLVQMGSDIFGHPTARYSTVAMNESGDTIVVGGSSSDTYGYDSGVARVYRFVDNNWNQLGQSIYGHEKLGRTGKMVRINDTGNRIFVSFDGYQYFSGRSKVYDFDGNEWIEKSQFVDQHDQIQFIFDKSGEYFAVNDDGADQNKLKIFSLDFLPSEMPSPSPTPTNLNPIPTPTPSPSPTPVPMNKFIYKEDLERAVGRWNGSRSFAMELYGDINTWDVSEITDMFELFRNKSNITDLNLSNWDTSKVTNMGFMFNGCSSLTSLNLSGNFNTQNVTNMTSMFNWCTALNSITFGNNFNTQNVTYMDYMFTHCTNLTELDLSNFDTRSVTTMYSMFDDCHKLTTLNLSNLDTRNVTNMQFMFQYCFELTSVNLGGDFNTNKVTNMHSMFKECRKLNSILGISSWNLSSLNSVAHMFDECETLETIDLSSWNVSLVTDFWDMFTDCTSLSSVGDISNWDVSSGLNMSEMFDNCSSLNFVGDLSNWCVTNITTEPRNFARNSPWYTDTTKRPIWGTC